MIFSSIPLSSVEYLCHCAAAACCSFLWQQLFFFLSLSRFFSLSGSEMEIMPAQAMRQKKEEETKAAAVKKSNNSSRVQKINHNYRFSKSDKLLFTLGAHSRSDLWR
jgi:hypothetical protein